MLLNLFSLIAITIGMAVIFIAGYSLYKRNTKTKDTGQASFPPKPPKTRKEAFVRLVGSLWLLTTITLIPGTIYLKTKVYIINKEGDFSTKYLFGSATYKTSYGKKVVLNTGNHNIIVVNEMEKALILERLIYGKDLFADAKIDAIPALSVSELDATSIDYGLNETPPKTLKGWFEKEKFHLRTNDDLLKEMKDFQKMSDELDKELEKGRK